MASEKFDWETFGENECGWDDVGEYWIVLED